MLQWMGGSRRKVTTSRKSTQKRQKQYFEQRKRQQQETAFIENNADSLDTCDHQKRNRSLDILSLHNVSKVTEECKPLHGTENLSSITKKATRESFSEDVNSSLIGKSGGHGFSASYHTSMSSPMTTSGKLTAMECTLPTATRVPSSHQMGRVSSKSARKTSTSNVQNLESEYVKSASSTQPSIFDIIGDGAIGISEGEPAQEAHVAFSIEGLGKVGSETPLQSPQHPGSKLNGEQSKFTKAAKSIYPSKTFNTMLDNLDMEVDVEEPVCHNRLFEDELYPTDSVEHELLTFKNSTQPGGKQCEINPFYDEDRHNIFLNDSSPFLNDYNEIDEKCGVNWKNYDARHATDNAFTWRNDISDLKFERCYSQSPPRFQGNIPDRSDYLDGNHCFPASDEPKYSSFVCNYHTQDRFSPIKRLKDTRDYLTSYSGGESCSSTAVGGESTADMPSAGHIRIYGKELNDLNMPCKSNNFDEDMWNIMPTSLKQGTQCHSSRKQVRSESSHLKPALFSRLPVNEREGNRLFEEDFPLPKMNVNPESLFTSFEKKQHRRGDSFNIDEGAEFHRSKGFFDDSMKDTPNDFSSEAYAFHQPFCSRQSGNTSFISKAGYGRSSLGVQDFEVHVQSSNSSEIFGDSESAFPAPELSAQESVTEERGNRSQSQPPWPENLNQPVSPENKNFTPESELPIQETTLKGYNGSQNMPNEEYSQEVNTHSLEADEDNVQNSPRTPTKESLGCVPVLCRQKVQVFVDDIGRFMGNDVDDDNIKGTEPKTNMIDPCFQLMTVESMVLIINNQLVANAQSQTFMSNDECDRPDPPSHCLANPQHNFVDEAAIKHRRSET